MKFRALQLILPAIVIVGGGAAANYLVLSEKTKNAIYSDWDRVEDGDDFDDFINKYSINIYD